jgi:hypothetical protein
VPPRVRKGEDGLSIMEYDVNTSTTHVTELRFSVRPYGFWRKIGYLLGIIKPGNILAEIESGMIEGKPGNISYIDMQRFPKISHTEYKGFGRMVAGNGVLRIIVDESVERGEWFWSFEFETVFN